MKNVMLCLLMLSAAAGCDARGFSRLADVSIIDRETGVTLTPHYYRGEYWVAGNPGARYAIEIRNRLAERVLAVTSVDGVNVVSGEDAAWNQPGYVFNPGERYEVTGWRKSDAEVAAFTFTDASNSYAERTGRPANVGVIGVAIFRERQPEPLYSWPRIGGQLPYREAPVAGSAQSPADAAASASTAAPNALRAPMPSEKLGTGHGEREYSSVQRTDFVRLRPQPEEIIRIRYDSLENLVAMGIIAHRGVEPRPSPFPGSPASGYVPDPPG
ncbi:MAG TPA: hypothetical protein VKG05_00810 [Steroidobacteraceae bacterium]|nr:hypothetical protein [Steroidobacteraceae bacterium]